MSSTACRCYSGTACPEASSGAEEFFTEVKTEELYEAINDVVKDYVRLRGLRDVCQDVRRWGSPPGPTSYLDSGLLRVRGTSSLPRGLPCYRGRVAGSVCRDEKSGRSIGGGSRLGRSQVGPHLTWKSEGLGGSASQQVLSYDEGDIPVNCERSTAGGVQGSNGISVMRRGPSAVDRGCGELMESQSTPELAGQNTRERVVKKMTKGEFNADQAKKLLILLGHEHTNAQRGVSRELDSRPCRSRRPLSSGDRISSRPFSPADEWDDSGIFTVVPRPKTVSYGKRRHEQQQHVLTASVFSMPSSPTLPRPSIGSFVLPSKSEIWRNTRQFSRGGIMDESLDFWTKRRREVGGGGGDSALELFDIREAALVRFIETLARWILPWQAQLCPRALQDLELARMRVFYAVERQRIADCKARRDGLLRNLLLGEKKSWQSFAREQRRLLETTINKEFQRTKDWSKIEMENLTSWTRSSEVKVVKESSRRFLNDLEENEFQCAWLHKVSTQADIVWDRFVGATKKKVDHERQIMSTCELWLEKEAHVAARYDAFRYLGMSGARALSSKGFVRRKRAIIKTMAKDADRASNDRAKERQSSSKRYEGICEALWETRKVSKNVRGKSVEAWSLHEWMSVGTHKLVQQSLRAQVSRYMHSDEVRNVLWEAHEATEFASATRAAATSQRISNARNVYSFRQARDTIIQGHQRRKLQDENIRITAEDIERERAKTNMVRDVKRSVSVWRGKADALFKAERSKILAIRREDAERTARYRKEMSALQRDLESEVERVANALREWQNEEEKRIEIEVLAGAKSFNEEQARAYERETLFHEIMLRERKNQDRFLREWIKERERIESAFVSKEIKEACRRLEDDRTRWVKGVVTSVSSRAKVDASSLRNPSAWETTTPLSPDPTEHCSNTTVSSPLQLQLEGRETFGEVVESRGITMTPDIQVGTIGEIEGRKLHAIQRARASAAVEELSAAKRNARIESLAVLIQRGLASHWTEFWRVELERVCMAAEAVELAAVQWAGRQWEEAEVVRSMWQSRAWSYSAQQMGTPKDGSISELSVCGREDWNAMNATGADVDIADAHSLQILSLAKPLVDGTTYSIRRDKTEVPAPLLENAVGEVQKESGATDLEGPSLQGNMHEKKLGSTPEVWRQSNEREPKIDQPSVEGIASGGKADTGWKDQGINEREGIKALNEMNIHSLESTDKFRPAGGNRRERNTQGAACSIDVCELDDNGIVALESSVDGDDNEKNQHPVPPAPGDDTSMGVHVPGEDLSGEERKPKRIDAESRCSQWESTASKEPAWFVGITMSRHLSTFPRCYVDAVREASSSRTLSGDPSLKVGKTSSESFVSSRCHGSEEDVEFGWVNTLQTLVGCNEVVGLEELGRTFCTVRGGAVVLCLAHDGLIDEDKENGGCVRAEILLSSTTALATSRQKARKTGSIPTIISEASLSRIAKAETNLEMGIIGEELCGDLAQIFQNSSDTLEERDVYRRTNWVRRTLQKHSALLSPQSVCALTALLSARGVPLNASGTISHGCDGDSLSSLADIAVWQSTVSEALLTVRVASLEHAAIWANACDPVEVESAFYAHASALEKLMPTTGSDTEHAIRSIGVAWTSLNKVSGLGLSSLMLLGITLPDYGDVLGAPSDGRFRHSNYGSIASNPDNAPSVSGVSSSSISRVVRSALNVLSLSSLENLSRRLATPCKKTSLAPVNALGVGDEGDCETREPEILSDVRGDPAIGDLSRRDVVTLRKDFAGLVAALDVRNTGALPLSALAAVLQSGRAGFALETAQAHAVLHLAGLLKPKHHLVVESPTPACQASGKTPSAGEYRYLGFAPEIFAAPYSEMVDKVPGILRLIQAAHRLRSIAAVATTAESREVGRAGLERARTARFRREIDRCAASFVEALDVVRQRVSYGRLKRWSAQLEAPRLENMQRLLARGQESASNAKKIRAIENSRRAELRHAFTSAILERVAFGCSSGATLTVTVAARTRASTQLWAAMGRSMVQAREGLMATAKRLGASLAEAEDRALWDEGVRRAEYDNARKWCDAEPEWWGKGLTQEVQSSYREKVKWVQKRGEKLLATISALAKKVVITWEKDAKECKEALAETENRLNILMADFEGKSDAPRATPPEENTFPLPGQTNIAGPVLSQHHDTQLSWVTFASRGAAVKDLDAECIKHCESATGLMEGAKKRLDWVLKTSAARARQERSFAAKRLHAVSIYWQGELPKRQQRWEELQISRRLSYGRKRADLQASYNPLDLMASLSQGQNMAEMVVKKFIETAAEGPVELEAKATIVSAAEALVNAHEAVKTSAAEAGCTIDDQFSGAIDLVEITMEDAFNRVSTCQKAIGEWWEVQRAALEGELRKREQEMERRITRREVRCLLQDLIVPEIEARHNSESLARKTLDLVLVESMRTMELLNTAERTAMKHLHGVTDAAYATLARESETLELEANALYQTVPWAILRGSGYVTDDLADL